jgi:ribosomal protein S13
MTPGPSRNHAPPVPHSPVGQGAAATPATNALIAECLNEAADLLLAQGENHFRAEAFRRGARTVIDLPEDIAQTVARAGPDALLRLPGIGRGIASAIIELVATGRWSRLDRLRGEVDAEILFTAVPGIGPTLAKRIHDDLDIDSLQALECAAHDGRLRTLSGIGARRAAAIQAALAAMLGNRLAARPGPAPGIAVLLAVDAMYRRKAVTGSLPTIAPRRFNPSQRAWLPILHTRRGDWHFTALFSNSARAHQLQRTSDWVVLYYYDGDHQERQCTVVTETRGPLRGERVVRGRETECEAHYAKARS